MNTEIWFPVQGLETSYHVSSNGAIKSLNRIVPGKNGQPLPIKEKILREDLTTSGYAQISLCKRKYMVHRLVAKAFIPNPENKPEVNHIDGDKLNNIVSNLEWNTRSENQNHAKKKGLLAVGTRQPGSKLKDNDIPEIFKLRIEGLSYEAIARKYGVDFSLIEKVLKRKLWKHIPVMLSLLLFFNWIPLSGSSQVLDTTRSYGVHELRIIADTLTKCEQYRKLLGVTTEQLSNREFVITQYEKELRGALAVSVLKESIISVKQQEINTINLQLKSTERKLWLTKAGWITTSIGLLTLSGYLLIH